MTDRYLDLLKQGFMKPRKQTRRILFQHWLPNGEGMSCETPIKAYAENALRKYGGEIRKVKGESR